MNEIPEANRVDVSSIEQDLKRGGSRHARRWMVVDVRPLNYPLPGGYTCEQGLQRIAVPENKVAAIMALAATDQDRADMVRAKQRFGEEIAAARAKGLTPEMVGFSPESIFRTIAGHDYPALESATLMDADPLPPETVHSEQRALEAQAHMLAGVVRDVIFAKPDA